MSLRHLATTIFDAGILKPKYLFKDYSFYKNIHSKQIFIFKNPEYSFKTNILFFLKSRTFIQKIHFLKEAYRPGLWTGGFVARLDYYLGHEKDCQEVLASVPTGA